MQNHTNEHALKIFQQLLERPRHKYTQYSRRLSWQGKSQEESSLYLERGFLMIFANLHINVLPSLLSIRGLHHKRDHGILNVFLMVSVLFVSFS